MLKSVMQSLHAPIYRARIKALIDAIVPHLRESDCVLDVGCGSGVLAQAILTSPQCPANVAVEGLERVKRGNEPICVHEYQGGPIPFAAQSYDVVILADVLHHEQDAVKLLKECARIARRLVVIKDHQVQGILAQQRICLLDWAANAPYGVPCLYRYNTPDEWRSVPAALGFEVQHELTSMNVYPPIVNLMLGRRLHYFAVLRRPAEEVLPESLA